MTRASTAFAYLVALSVASGCFNPSDPDMADTGGTDGGTSMGSADSTTSASDASASGPDSGSASNTGPTTTSGDGPCDPNPCANGLCVPDGDAFICECEAGWEGDDCSVNIDDCVDAPCVNGTCVDDVAGFTCECDSGYEGDLCDTVAQPFCLRGTITVTDAFDDVNGNPSTMAFEHLEGETIDFNLVFGVPDSQTVINTDDFSPYPLGQLRVLDAQIQSFESSDIFMTNEFGAAYEGMSYDGIALVNGTNLVGISVGNMVSPEGNEYWGLESSSTEVPIVVDDQSGFPVLLPSEGSGSGSVILRRYQNGTPLMTDFAQATWDVALQNGTDCD